MSDGVSLSGYAALTRSTMLRPQSQLGTWVEYTSIPVAGRYHRALADAEMKASLVLKMQQDLIR